VDGTPHRVVGVAAEGFEFSIPAFPTPGQLWVPLKELRGPVWLPPAYLIARALRTWLAAWLGDAGGPLENGVRGLFGGPPRSAGVRVLHRHQPRLRCSASCRAWRSRRVRTTAL
jgi:hypothetical protein